MDRRPRISLVLIALIIALALPSVRADERTSRARVKPDRAYAVVAPAQPLTAEARTALEARGIHVLRALGGGRYIVWGSSDAIARLPGTHRISIDGKIGPSIGYSLRADGRRDLRVLFREDASFEDAKTLVEDLGGEVAPGFECRFGVLRSLRVFLPGSALHALVADDRVAQVDGSLWPLVTANANAAMLSDVPPLYDAPYDLDGAGETASVYEYGTIDATHPEFTGRVTNVNPTGNVDAHKTFCAGTIGAAGLRSIAKGMAPAVSIVGYDLEPGGVPETKLNRLRQGITADNNSISTPAGWYGVFGGIWSWYGEKEKGGYNYVTAALDEIAIETNVLIVTASGNDNAKVGPTAPPYKHRHSNADPVDSRIYCFEEQPGSGCPTSECDVCETERHPPDGPYGSTNSYADGKNTISVGAVSRQGMILDFSSTGPMKDGRIKPDVVADGDTLWSTVPTGGQYLYGYSSGTSMSAPVVTGIATLVAQQWRRLHVEPLRVDLMRALLIWGARDLGNTGPDYTYGFGLVDAKASVDAIRNDAASPGLIRQGAVNQGEERDYSVDVEEPGPLEIVLTWADPPGMPYDYPTLVNDLDMELVDPNGEVIRPWVLDPNHPDAPSTRGVNHIDNVEQIEWTADPGQYELHVRGTRIAADGPQTYAIVSTHHLEEQQTGCSDPFEPNDTIDEAWPWVRSAVPVDSILCGPDDPIDDFLFRTSDSGQVVIDVAAVDHDLNVSLLRDGELVQSWVARVGETNEVSVSSSGQATFVVEISAAAAESTSSRYVLTATFPNARRRPVARPVG